MTRNKKITIYRIAVVVAIASAYVACSMAIDLCSKKKG